ncbi:MAG TPA: hypothetical protein VF148_12130 [Acidimicrobiia bacterium]
MRTPAGRGRSAGRPGDAKTEWWGNLSDEHECVCGYEDGCFDGQRGRPRVGRHEVRRSGQESDHGVARYPEAGSGGGAVGDPGPGSGGWCRHQTSPSGPFFVLAYLFCWSYWLPIALAGGEASHLPGLLGSMLAAFTVTSAARGRVGELVSRMFRSRVPLRWYAAARRRPQPAPSVSALSSSLEMDGQPSET